MARIHASYFTDPACAASWGAEPALRRLQVEFGAEVEITYVMAGLAREFVPGPERVGEWLDVAEASGMPVDPRLWLSAPPRSSYPACMAVKAAAEQGQAGPYLRRLREGLMCGRRKLDHAEAFVQEARALGGLDVGRFSVDLGSHAIVEAFGADLERARALEEPWPVLELRGADAEAHLVAPHEGYPAWREAVMAAGATAAEAPWPGVEEALRRFGTLATPEVAAVCDLPGPRAAAELWRLAEAWAVRPERRLTGELWALA
jgi:predicted DsbA family dithiol-disulfide isomerase